MIPCLKKKRGEGREEGGTEGLRDGGRERDSVTLGTAFTMVPTHGIAAQDRC